MAPDEGVNMKCNKCSVGIAAGEERDHQGETLCEDCYIDVLSPAKFCDPWADYAAKSHIEKNPDSSLNANQKKIIQLLHDHGEVEPAFLIDRLKHQISPEDGERECAAIHRMGIIAIENNDGKIIIKLKR